VKFFASLILGGLIFAEAATVQCQTPPASPVPKSQSSPPAPESQEPVRVFTEEVLIPIFAFDANGRFDPTLNADDLIVFEDDVIQEIRTVSREPSNVLLLLDTAGGLNPAMKISTTRDIATALVSNLQTQDRVATVQFGDGVEVVHGWTRERETILRALKTKLRFAQRSSLVQGLVAATVRLNEVPAGSKHVVLITDGVDSSGEKPDLARAVRELLSAHATVHVISYTSIGRKAIKSQNPLVKVTNEKRKSAQDIANEIMYPNEPWEEVRRRKIYVIIDTDIAMRRLRNRYQEAMMQGEQWLGALANETGGQMILPLSTDEMIKQGASVARQIDGQYVVAYRPKRPLAVAEEGEYRNIKVVSRRGGLDVYARKGYEAKTQRK
jgi:VWFA-related protein